MTLTSIDEDSQSLDTMTTKMSNRTLLDKISPSTSISKPNKLHKTNHHHHHQQSNINNRNHPLDPIPSQSTTELEGKNNNNNNNNNSNSYNNLENENINNNDNKNINQKHSQIHQLQKDIPINVSFGEENFENGFEDPATSRSNQSSKPSLNSLSYLPSSPITSQMFDCETPRIPTWTDLSYADIPVSKQIILQPLHLERKVQEKEEYVATSRSDESDYEIEWNRANLKLLKK